MLHRPHFMSRAVTQPPGLRPMDVFITGPAFVRLTRPPLPVGLCYMPSPCLALVASLLKIFLDELSYQNVISLFREATGRNWHLCQTVAGAPAGELLNLNFDGIWMRNDS